MARWPGKSKLTAPRAAKALDAARLAGHADRTLEAQVANFLYDTNRVARVMPLREHNRQPVKGLAQLGARHRLDRRHLVLSERTTEPCRLEPHVVEPEAGLDGRRA
jgi:hypothetical protein